MNTKQLRQKILDLAIHGKLVPQDPNDEPASVLLKRIRKEKEKLIKEGKIKRSKNESAPISSDDKSHYGKLPPGWELCRLGDVIIVNPRNEVNDNTLASFVPMTLIKDGFSNQFYFQERIWGKIKEGFTHFQDGDVGLAKITPCLENRKSVVFHGLLNGIGAGTTELHIFRPFQNTIIPEYLLWFIKNENFINDCISAFSGAVGQQRISKDYICGYFISLPPLAEQHRIVSAIESSFAVIDEIEENKIDLLTTVSNAKAKILSLAIIGKLVPQDPNDEPASVLLERIHKEREKLIKTGKIKPDKKQKSVIQNCDDNSYYADVPKTWGYCHLSFCWELISGRDLEPTEYTDKPTGIPYITGASNFENGKITINRWTKIPKVVANQDDILIICKGTVGEMLVCQLPKCHIARQIMAIRNIFDLNVDFLQFYLKHHLSKITASARGIIPGISREDLLDIPLPIPPLAEQKRIVTAIEIAFKQLDTISDLLS